MNKTNNLLSKGLCHALQMRDSLGYAITKMVTKHIYDQPVEKLIIKNGKCVEGELFMFNLWDDDPSNTMTEKIIAPWKVLSLDLLSPANCTFSYIQNNNTFVYNSDYSEKVIFDEYDNFGNILQYHEINDITVSFQWGYNNELMIAKGENINNNDNEAYSNNHLFYLNSFLSNSSKQII